MTPQQIEAILRGEHGANLNMGVEEDDILARTFFGLPKEEKDAFWPNFAQAMESLIESREDLPVYLAARFLFSMGEIKPSQLPRKKTPFNFLLNIQLENTSPSQLAGVLLAELLLKLGKTDYWENAIDTTLKSLEAGSEAPHAMAAVVYAFLAYNRCDTIPAETWNRLFRALAHLPRLPRMELLELLVGVEKEAKFPERMGEELDVSLEQGPSHRGNEFHDLEPSFKHVLQAWLDLNTPHPAIEALLKRKLTESRTPSRAKLWTLSPRQVVEHFREAA